MLLTKRQKEVVELLAKGLGQKQIARDLKISDAAVAQLLMRAKLANWVDNEFQLGMMWANRKEGV